MLSGVAAAQTAKQETMEQRVARLERLLGEVLERMKAQEQVNARDAEVIAQAQAAVQAQAAQTKAVTDQVAAQTARVDEAVKRSTADGFRVGKTTFKMGGYLKADVSMTRYSGGDTAPNALIDDFYLPQQIPVGGAGQGWDVNYNARETRVWLEGQTEVAGHKLLGRVEVDFQAVATNADERATNGYSPELRQAYVQWDKWTLGQTWSTFQNVGALPEGIEFIGPTEGTVFVRQPLVRYTDGNFQISLEQPETTVTSRTGFTVDAGQALAVGSTIVTNDGTLPDIVARVGQKGAWGEVALAGVLRQLKCDTCGRLGGVAVDDSAVGWGFSGSGLIKVGKTDDIRFMINGGKGLGRYIGVNIINDAALTTAGDLQPIGMISGYVAYRHVWRPGLRSTIHGSYFKADNPVALTGGAVTDEIWSGLVNLLWSPTPPLTFGVEYLYAERKLENGLSGTMNRFQFSTKYAF
jgi:hypothetical protein